MTLPDLEPLIAGFPAIRRWVVAFSGGLDSSVLLHLCAGFRAARPGAPELLALHIDHGVHPRSTDWVAHCAAVCAGLGVAFESRRARLSPGASHPASEDALRIARYREFEEFCARDDMLLLAHHQDDQAETVLLRLIRGAGPAGLAAMPRTRALARSRLYRPLLDTPRSALREHALLNALEWIEDPSNVSSVHDRSHLRTRLLPLIESRWPGAGERMARAAQHCAEAAWICGERAREDLEQLCGVDWLGLPFLALESWRVMARARARNALRAWLARHDAAIDAQRVETVVRELIEARAGRQPLIALGRVSLRRFNDRLYAVEALPPVPDQEIAIEAGGGPHSVPGAGRVCLVRSATGVRSGGQCTIRFRQPGISIRVTGRPRKSLKKLLQELSVPPWLRDRVPLLYVDGELAAVADLCICEGFAAPPGEPAVALRWRPAETSRDISLTI